MKNKVLIIDDDSKNIFALTATLESRHYHTISAMSGYEGMQVIKQDDDIGVILMDMMMPDMDGYELIREIRKNQSVKNIPVIAVTAQAMVGDKEKCLAAGADHYVAKPIDVDVLVSLLNEYIKS